MLISTRQTFQGDLTGFLIGNLQGVSAGDIAISAAVGLAIIVVLAAVHKELVLVSFDRTLASALGYPVFALDALLLVILTVTIVVSIQAVGIILVLAMLVTPAATARLLVDRFVPMMALGLILGAAVGVAGLLHVVPPGDGLRRHDRAAGDRRLRGGLRGHPAARAAGTTASPSSPARGLAHRRSATGPSARGSGGRRACIRRRIAYVPSLRWYGLLTTIQGRRRRRPWI